MKSDINAVMERDPAARTKLEVMLLYSGYKAVRRHRRAHWFFNHNMKFIARYLSQRNRHKSGIEIHPAAQLGKGVFIDHGMGVVIGETTVVGDNCTIYQNVTLGGTGKDVGKRHPTLGNNVLVGSGAKVLGLREVPANATAVGVPARIVKLNGIRSETLDQIHVSDPVANALVALDNRISELENEVNTLRGK